MYPVENIVRSVTRTADDKLDIIVFCDNEEDYILELCKTGHNFFSFQDFYPIQWKRDPSQKPFNLKFLQNTTAACKRHYDLIIVFNRVSQWEAASKLSRAFHIPMIVVDMATFNTKIQRPFFTDFRLPNEDQLHLRGGDISVGASTIASDSWTSHFSNFSITIDLPISSHLKNSCPNLASNKIAICMDLHNDYVQGLPIDFPLDKFTTDLGDAGFYLHLWQNITPKMLEAMSMGIPILTFQSVEFEELVKQEAIILLQNIESLAHPNVVADLKSFRGYNMVINNAKKFVNDRHSNDAFLKDWFHILDFSKNMFYTRGQNAQRN